MRFKKLVVGVLMAALMAVAVPYKAQAQSAYDYEVLATFQYPTPEESCAAATNQMYITYGTITWLSSLAMPGSGSTISAEALAGALTAAYLYVGALGFTYWWYDCSHRIF